MIKIFCKICKDEVAFENHAQAWLEGWNLTDSMGKIGVCPSCSNESEEDENEQSS